MFLNAFKNLFTSKTTNKLSKKGIRRRLELLGLEERVVPATFTVVNNSDSGAGSLRQAIIDANATVANDIIDFNFATGSSPYTITLAAALPNIVDASTAGTLTITGLGASSLIIDANQGNFSIFTINTGADFTISDVTISGANNSNNGGAFNNSGTLTISNSTLSGNTANNGGGIDNFGILSISNSTLSGNTALSGGGIYNRANGTLSISNSTLSTNNANYGGGIRSSGILTVSNSTISGNTALVGGGILNGGSGNLTVSNSTFSGNSATKYGGGGIANFNFSTLTVSNSTFSGNSAANNGGGISNFGTLNIANTIIANSTSGGDYGDNSSSIVNLISPSTAANNLVSQGTFSWATTKTSAEINLGTLANNGGPTQTLALLNGSAAIGAGNATVSNASPVNGLDQRSISRTTSDIGAYSYGIQVTTTANAGAGSLRQAIDDANSTPGNDQISFNLTGSSSYTIALASALPNIVNASTAGTLTINGLGASSLTIDYNQGNFSIFTINSGGNLSISGVTVTGANTSGTGGAFNNSGTLSISNSILSGNTASKGGGIYNNPNANLSISNSTLSGNNAIFGAGIYNSGGNLNVTNSTLDNNIASNPGGGILNTNSGTVTVTNSTFSNNSAAGNGGGIYNESILYVYNSTFSGNSTASGGGGIFNNNLLTVINSTLSGNSQNGNSGGILNYNGTLNIANTIIANSIGNGDYEDTPSSIVNLISPSTAANNLVSTGTFSWATTKTSAQINLGTLANNGGPTFTMALGAGSPAIGAGDATISNAAPVYGLDQRGVTRSSTAPSIGAYEFLTATQVALTTAASGSVSGSAFTTQPVITIQDSLGNPVNTTASVTMTVSGGDGNATTVGTTTVNAINGVVTFTDVGISGTAGTAYTLTFDSAGLTSATQSITPLGAANTPAFGTPTATADGFTVLISNFDVNFTYAGTATAGSVSIDGSGLVTVTGVSSNTSSTATITTAQTGFANGSAQVTATSLNAANTPAFGTPTATADGFTVLISNYDVSFTYAGTATAGSVSIDGSGLVTVTGVSSNTSSTATITTTRTGYVSGSAQVTETSLNAANTPAFGTPTATADGFTVLISNFDVNFTYAGTATAGSVSIDGSGLVTVTGVAAGTSSTATITTTRTGYANGSAQISATGLNAANTPVFGTPTATADGFTVLISNYDASFTYGATATAGSVSVDSSGLVTVTGVSPNTSSTATITTTRTNYVNGSAQVTATSLNAANTPTFGTPIATADGFTVLISNYDVNFIYGGTATAGSVSVDSSGLVTVTGVSPNTSSTATITTTRTNYVSGSAQVTATSLNAANTPAFGTPTATADGFTVLISNFDANFTYAGTATAGSVSVDSSGLVTVTGVSPNTSSTATITTTRTNYVSGSAQVTATSLAPTPTPTPTAPLVTGTPPPSSGGSSTVTLYDPATGEPTGSVVPFPGFNGPVKVVSGDFNNDGVADIIAGAGFGGGPAIAILDSQTGQVMESFFAFDPAFTGGVFVAVQDVNSDGILDIIASAGPGGGPEVRIFDGRTLNVLRAFYAYDQAFTGGVSVASIDFNNDGILDLVTGAGPGGSPHVKVYDGATNAIISQWYAYPVSFTGGVYVAAGDIGNDGNIEVVTGAGQGGSPVVAVWDPYTGALLAQFMAYADDFTGGVRVGINDGNSDGIADIVTGAGPGGGPQVNVFNFPALDLLFSFYSGDPANTGGVFVS